MTGIELFSVLCKGESQEDKDHTTIGKEEIAPKIIHIFLVFLPSEGGIK